MITNSIVLYLIYLNNFFIPKILGIILLYTLCRLLFKLLVIDLLPNGYEILDLKIKNNLYNWFVVCFCIAIFVIGFSILRIYRSSFVLDLTPICEYLKLLYITGDYLFLLLIVFSFILYLLLLVNILKRVKTYCEVYLLQRHIYIRYKKEGYFPWTVPLDHRTLIWCRYKEFIYWFNRFDYHTLKGHISNLLLAIGLYLERNNYKKLHKIRRKFEALLLNSLNIKYNVFILPILVLYDCYFNSFVITLLFKFLPFYFFYTIWYKLSLFWYDKTVDVMDRILYEMYYCNDNIKYV